MSLKGKIKECHWFLRSHYIETRDHEQVDTIVL